ncbi:MAG: PqqD family protein [Lawsonibacter sp.]
MAKKHNNNYLDFIPIINPKNEWSTGKDGLVTVHMVHRGFYASIAQKCFHTPRISHIKLDEYGSFLWKEIDGVRTVGTLALQMKEQFGDEAEPLYDRLVKYMQILRNNRFILFQGKDRVNP